MLKINTRWKKIQSLDNGLCLYMEKLTALLENRLNFIEKFDDSYFDQPFMTLLDDNYSFYQELVEDYENSFANPHYSKALLPEVLVDLCSSLYYEAIMMIQPIFQKKPEMVMYVVNKYNLLNTTLPDIDKTLTEFVRFEADNQKTKLDDSIRFMYSKTSPLMEIYNKIDLTDSRYLFRYGIYITENEVKAWEVLNKFPQNYANELAMQMIRGFTNGFITHNRHGKNRHTSRIVQVVGMEAVGKCILANLKDDGKDGYIGDLVSTPCNAQAAADYTQCSKYCMNEDVIQKNLESYEEVLNKYKEELLDYNGNIIMVCFGRKKDKIELYQPIHDYSALIKQNEMRKKILFETFVPKSEISYTGMAYPLYAIRNNDYAHIFSEVMKINRMDPSPYEKIQQLLITELDKAQYVEIKGDNGNETNIRIALNDNLNRSCESNFVNCGADVNIPVGEVYTSPKLKGTNGLLHLQKIYISNIEFNDLKLKVENGFVVDYSCSNGDNLEESRQMIERYVLNGRKSLPLGEFALGTNTFAYSIVKKLGILHQLHTLIYEKLGPHIALGDTCFSWSEDNPICNQFDGKLIVGKDNEVSILRKEDPSKAYFGYHKDLTIPYDEIALIQAICEDGTNISILENGHFVLTGCEYLNQFLC